MNWLRNFMRGRNGPDQMTLGAMAVWLVLSLLLAFVPRHLAFLRLLTYLPLIYAIFRMLSRDLAKRQLENERFMLWWNRFLPKVKKKADRMKDNKTHRYIKCPTCKQTLRIPRGRGKLRITCPKCGQSFESRS